MRLLRLAIRGISYTENQSNVYTLILDEIGGNRKIPIVIGSFEAQAIAIALNKNISPPRPITHDFFRTFAERFGIQLRQVIIHKLVDGIFYSSVICEKDGIEEIIDARTSDAIALSVRFKTPVFIHESILEKVGIINLDEYHLEIESQNSGSEKTDANSVNDYGHASKSDLKEMLKKAIDLEKYEIAAKIRDEIEKRERNNDV